MESKKYFCGINRINTFFSVIKSSVTCFVISIVGFSFFYGTIYYISKQNASVLVSSFFALISFFGLILIIGLLLLLSSLPNFKRYFNEKTAYNKGTKSVGYFEYEVNSLMEPKYSYIMYSFKDENGKTIKAKTFYAYSSRAKNYLTFLKTFDIYVYKNCSVIVEKVDDDSLDDLEKREHIDLNSYHPCINK